MFPLRLFPFAKMRRMLWLSLRPASTHWVLIFCIWKYRAEKLVLVYNCGTENLLIFCWSFVDKINVTSINYPHSININKSSTILCLKSINFQHHNMLSSNYQLEINTVSTSNIQSTNYQSSVCLTMSNDITIFLRQHTVNTWSTFNW